MLATNNTTLDHFLQLSRQIVAADVQDEQEIISPMLMLLLSCCVVHLSYHHRSSSYKTTMSSLHATYALQHFLPKNFIFFASLAMF